MNIRYTVFYENNLLLRYIIDTRQEADCLMAHHHNFVGHFANLFQHCFFVVGRCIKDSVKSHYQRNFKPVKQRKNVDTILTTKDSKLMLQYT